MHPLLPPDNFCTFGPYADMPEELREYPIAQNLWAREELELPDYRAICTIERIDQKLEKFLAQRQIRLTNKQMVLWRELATRSLTHLPTTLSLVDECARIRPDLRWPTARTADGRAARSKLLRTLRELRLLDIIPVMNCHRGHGKPHVLQACRPEEWGTDRPTARIYDGKSSRELAGEARTARRREFAFDIYTGAVRHRETGAIAYIYEQRLVRQWKSHQQFARLREVQMLRRSNLMGAQKYGAKHQLYVPADFSGTSDGGSETPENADDCETTTCNADSKEMKLSLSSLKEREAPGTPGTGEAGVGSCTPEPAAVRMNSFSRKKSGIYDQFPGIGDLIEHAENNSELDLSPELERRVIFNRTFDGSASRKIRHERRAKIRAYWHTRLEVDPNCEDLGLLRPAIEALHPDVTPADLWTARGSLNALLVTRLFRGKLHNADLLAWLFHSWEGRVLREITCIPDLDFLPDDTDQLPEMLKMAWWWYQKYAWPWTKSAGVIFKKDVYRAEILTITRDYLRWRNRVDAIGLMYDEPGRAYNWQRTRRYREIFWYPQQRVWGPTLKLMASGCWARPDEAPRGHEFAPVGHVWREALEPDLEMINLLWEAEMGGEPEHIKDIWQQAVRPRLEEDEPPFMLDWFVQMFRLYLEGQDVSRYLDDTHCTTARLRHLALGVSIGDWKALLARARQVDPDFRAEDVFGFSGNTRVFDELWMEAELAWHTSNILPKTHSGFDTAIFDVYERARDWDWGLPLGTNLRAEPDVDLDETAAVNYLVPGLIDTRQNRQVEPLGVHSMILTNLLEDPEAGPRLWLRLDELRRTSNSSDHLNFVRRDEHTGERYFTDPRVVPVYRFEPDHNKIQCN